MSAQAAIGTARLEQRHTGAKFPSQPRLCAVKFPVTYYFDNNAVSMLGTGDQ